MITDMEKWTNIRRDVLVDGMSRREALPILPLQRGPEAWVEHLPN